MTRTVTGIRDAVATGRASATEICHEFLARIDEREGQLHAFTLVDREAALRRATALDRTRGTADSRPLLGVPLAIKDNICMRGVRTTASSRILASYVPPFSATVIERLERAGAILVGKTNCDEFGMGSSTENSAFGVTRNPWAYERTPGGSSGGSAAAVAARLAAAALGSDTGGSIRQPAAMCGVVGLKPTYGRVSRYGLLAFASSLDQIGPFGLTVRDVAEVLQVTAGYDPSDSTSAAEQVPDLIGALSRPARGARIGVPRSMLAEGVDAGVLQAFWEALEVVQRLGAAVIDVDLPHARYGIPAYYLIATAEASANLARYDGVRYGFRAPLDAADATVSEMYERTRDLGFGAEVKRRIMLGAYALSAGYYDAYYLKAQQVRTLIRRDYERAFEQVDAVALPTSPVPAFRLGERLADPLQMYLGDVFTVSASLAGLPAISLPCGFTSERLPVGLQLVGRMFDEPALLALAEGYERECPWWREEPPFNRSVEEA